MYKGRTSEDNLHFEWCDDYHLFFPQEIRMLRFAVQPIARSFITENVCGSNTLIVMIRPNTNRLIRFGGKREIIIIMQVTQISM